MPSQPAVRVAFLALAIVVAVVVALFVWPGGYPAPSCSGYAPTFEPTTGRTYCAETVPSPHYSANYTVRDDTFELRLLLTPGGEQIVVNVTEADGTQASGTLGFLGMAPPPTASWFTPDGTAGVTARYEGNLTLLVAP